MNVFNRLVVLLLLLLIIVATALIVIVPQETFRLTAATFDWLRQSSSDYINSSDRLFFAGGRVIVGGVVVIACLVLIWLELRQPRKRTIRTQKLSGGDAHITVDSIEQRLAYNIDQLPDVVKVSPRINGRSRGVDGDPRALTRSTTRVPAPSAAGDSARRGIACPDRPPRPG